MNNIAERFHIALENQLAAVTLNGQSPMEQYRCSILICKKAMNKMKRYVSNYAFKDVAEEIHFFKEVKPLFYSKYIYFINVYNFLMQLPPGGEDAVRAYINFHLTDLQRFFDHNKAFYQYYRSGSTQMDEIYFTRGGFDVQMELEDFEEDEQYSTSHDYKLSKIMANEKFQDYLKLEYLKIGTEQLLPAPAADIFTFSHPSWTASPTDAIELIYSLKASGSVNNGNIDVSELVGIFEFVFRMEIKETYHKIIDIGRRKKTVPVFLNKLTDGLLRHLNDKLSLSVVIGLILLF
ncbi:MAG: RteC domain-containing protein [Bacteroidetes bacterium]|nr:RteC domain-containing protein [Bacteroidota bacterium]